MGRPNKSGVNYYLFFHLFIKSVIQQYLLNGNSMPDSALGAVLQEERNRLLHRIGVDEDKQMKFWEMVYGATSLCGDIGQIVLKIYTNLYERKG